MSAITIMEDEFVSLWYYPEWKIVHHKLHKFPDSQSFRRMLSAGAEYMERHNAEKWLSDDRNNTVVRDDDAHWGDTVWAPRVIKAGFKFWAIVMPRTAIGSLNMNRFAEEYRERGVEVRTFNHLERAMNWLKSAR